MVCNSYAQLKGPGAQVFSAANKTSLKFRCELCSGVGSPRSCPGLKMPDRLVRVLAELGFGAAAGFERCCPVPSTQRPSHRKRISSECPPGVLTHPLLGEHPSPPEPPGAPPASAPSSRRPAHARRGLRAGCRSTAGRTGGRCAARGTRCPGVPVPCAAAAPQPPRSHT